jgi:CheY-like chemotaxis protein
VDDEALVRASTADMLAELGYEVVEAESGEEALDLIDSRRPDLVITDHLMPGLSGTDLARILAAERPELPVLIVSGYADLDGLPADLPRLTKPFRQADLAACVANLRARRPAG